MSEKTWSTNQKGCRQAKLRCSQITYLYEAGCCNNSWLKRWAKKTRDKAQKLSNTAMHVSGAYCSAVSLQLRGVRPQVWVVLFVYWNISSVLWITKNNMKLCSLHSVTLEVSVQCHLLCSIHCLFFSPHSKFSFLFLLSIAMANEKWINFSCQWYISVSSLNFRGIRVYFSLYPYDKSSSSFSLSTIWYSSFCTRPSVSQAIRNVGNVHDCLPRLKVLKEAMIM